MKIHMIAWILVIVGALNWAPWLFPVVLVSSLAMIAALAFLVRSMSAAVPADAPSP